MLSIVIPARNEEAHIGACLAALAGQDSAELIEIIVADGMSEDATTVVVAEWAAKDSRVRLIENPGRVTPDGLNAGIRAAKGEVVGVMSAHAVPRPDYVRRALATLARTNAWAVGGRIDRLAASATQRAIARVTSSPYGVGNGAHNYATQAGPVETVFPGMWPRWVFDRVGMFDAELVRNQDDELSFRIREAGGVVWYDPDIVVAYEPRASLHGLFEQYRQYGFFRVRVYEKHPRAMRPRQLVPPAWVAFLAVGPAAARRSRAAGLVFASGVAMYAAVMGLQARRLADAKTPATMVFASFAVLHLGYGVGIWQGAWDRITRQLRVTRKPVA